MPKPTKPSDKGNAAQAGNETTVLAASKAAFPAVSNHPQSTGSAPKTYSSKVPSRIASVPDHVAFQKVMLERGLERG
jgi:hypothetical protein